MAEGAVRAAITDAAGGRVYHLTNDFDVTAAEMVRYAAVGLRRRIRTPHLPVAAARVMFRTLAVALVMTGRRDLVPHAMGVLEMLLSWNNAAMVFRDGRYTVLGWVASGMEVADKIRPGEVIEKVEAWTGR